MSLHNHDDVIIIFWEIMRSPQLILAEMKPINFSEIHFFDQICQIFLIIFFLFFCRLVLFFCCSTDFCLFLFFNICDTFSRINLFFSNINSFDIFWKSWIFQVLDFFYNFYIFIENCGGIYIKIWKIYCHMFLLLN